MPILVKNSENVVRIRSTKLKVYCKIRQNCLNMDSKNNDEIRQTEDSENILSIKIRANNIDLKHAKCFNSNEMKFKCSNKIALFHKNLMEKLKM